MIFVSEIMRLLQRFFVWLVGGRRSVWLKVDEKFNSSVRWHTWELLRENIKKVADHWNNLIGLERVNIGVNSWAERTKVDYAPVQKEHELA